jgi:hypothetical protein
MCTILPVEDEQFWAGRWSQNPDFNYEQVNQLYPIKKVFDEKMNKRVIMKLLTWKLWSDLSQSVATYLP